MPQGRLRAFFRKHFHPDEAASTPSPPPVASGAARVPAPSSSRSSTRPATPRSHHPPSGISVADRPITQPRPRRRRRRRTQSPVGLPLYSAQPGEEEMSIFKSTDMDASQLDLSISRTSTADNSLSDADDDDDDEDDRDEENEDSFFARPSIDVSLDSHHQRYGSSYGSPSLLVPPAIGNRPRSASEPLGAATRRGRSGSNASLARPGLGGASPYLSHSPGSSSPFASRSGLIDIPARPPSPPALSASPLTPPSLSPRRASYFAHRSSRSSPSNTFGTPPPSSALSSSLPASRPRAGTLQRLLGSSENASTASLVPPGAGGSPYGAALGARASSSGLSVREQGISAPVPNSFVHSSFVFPKSGPTPQQVAFLSSRESLGAYGYGPGVAPPAPPPPSFLGTEGPPPALGGRARSGSSASARSGTSPLAREVGSSSPPPAASLPVPVPVTVPSPPYSATPDLATAPAPAPAEEEPDPARPPVLPALSLPSAPLTLSPLATPSSTPPPSLEPSAAPRPVPLHLARARDPSADSPPVPTPEIVTLAPTPTQSRAPSPRLPPPSNEGRFRGARTKEEGEEDRKD
ncbi:uncharacterized protein JCM10292_006724 [Rhodotorula paludigena]|uniref:uncharacterized protein n=1 Tax=Rhodotorula paludigena TaxID=86838 RepID=UPI0031741A38